MDLEPDHMHWLFGKKRPRPRCLAPITNVSPIDFCFLTITVSDLPEPEYGVDYLRANDTYYSWLLPYIEAIKKATGKKIDLFDAISFGGDELESIEFECARAIEDLKHSSPTVGLDPVIQTNSDGTNIEYTRSLQTSELRNFIEVLSEMAALARAQNKYLTFYGQ